jgi:hypothetical protein
MVPIKHEIQWFSTIQNSFSNGSDELLLFATAITASASTDLERGKITCEATSVGTDLKAASSDLLEHGEGFVDIERKRENGN